MELRRRCTGMLWTAQMRLRSRWTSLRRVVARERGATAVEYALMVALIAAVIIGVVAVLGHQTSSAFGNYNSSFSSAAS
jgi:pilus assembly protein Flp/PilA